MNNAILTTVFAEMISEKPVHFLAAVQSMQTSETNATEDICTHVYLAACEMKHNMRKNCVDFWLLSESDAWLHPCTHWLACNIQTFAGYGKSHFVLLLAGCF